MPLVHGKSKKSFEKNVKTEIESGKPLKQSLAIAYDVQRKAKKKAKKENPAENASTPAFREYAEEKMAEGGEVPIWKKEGYKTRHQYARREGRRDLRVNAYHPSGELVGSARFKIEDDAYPIADNVWVNPDHQRKGLAMRMYDHAEKVLGERVVPSDDQTPEAKAFWEARRSRPKEYAEEKMAEGGEVEGRRMKRVSGSSFYYKPDDETLAKMREKKQDPNWHPPMKLEGEEEEMKYAHGGHVCSKCGHQDMEESDLESGSIAQKLLARKKFAKGGAVEDDVADLEANNTEGPGIDQSYNVNAKKDHKYDLDQLEKQPRDSNLKGRKLEDSIAARVLRKLKKGI